MENKQKEFHKSRREKLINSLGDDSLVIVLGSTNIARSYDDTHRFKQNKNFYYFTGFNQANAVLLLAKAGMEVHDGTTNKIVKTKELLFVQQEDPLKETWFGRRLGFQKVKQELGISLGMENTKLGDVISDLISKDKFSKIYISLHDLHELDGEIKDQLKGFTRSWITLSTNVQLLDLNYIAGKMRIVKTQFEIDQLRYAATVTASAYYNSIQQVKAGMYEYQIQAMLEYYYKELGCPDVAFETIVASGNNTCILHYNTNRNLIQKGDLVLIDSGAEYNYYNGDLTRTIPASGKFTKEQREIYQVVLDTQYAVIKKIKPGVKLSYLKKYSVEQLKKGVQKLGLLKKGFDITKYTLHGVGHHLGLDTHDAVANKIVGSNDFDTLTAGTIITVEPGLYFPESAKEIPANYRKIGVRIEDDVLLTRNGNEVLSDALPKEIEDIEFLMME
ncbi:MAG: aminopeptidase P N-terminal domain-containing protein [Ignavibacteria bacterium]|nr:aminopeptidase P N-terminal domain-containing protein [Ignavibacteria bacterium]